MSRNTCARLAADLYRERTASMTFISLRRKKCGCGKVVTSKQLQQYGACDPCVRAAAANQAEAA